MEDWECYFDKETIRTINEVLSYSLLLAIKSAVSDAYESGLVKACEGDTVAYGRGYEEGFIDGKREGEEDARSR